MSNTLQRKLGSHNCRPTTHTENNSYLFFLRSAQPRGVPRSREEVKNCKGALRANTHYSAGACSRQPCADTQRLYWSGRRREAPHSRKFDLAELPRTQPIFTRKLGGLPELPFQIFAYFVKNDDTPLQCDMPHYQDVTGVSTHTRVVTARSWKYKWQTPAFVRISVSPLAPFLCVSDGFAKRQISCT